MFFVQLRVFIFTHQNRIRSMFLEFPSKLNSFYGFRVFVDIRGRGDKVRIINFAHQNEFVVSFWSFFLDNRVRGGPLINVFLRVYFDVFCPTSRF